MKSKVTKGYIRNLIRSELSSLKESVDYSSIKNVVTGAEKLLSAIDAFKSTVPSAAINAVTPDIDNLKKMLEQMITNPDSYVEKNNVKKVSLKAVNSSNKLES